MDKTIERDKKAYQLQASMCGTRYAGTKICNTRTTEEDTRRILEWLKGKKHFLVLMGRVGCGKTYLCSAVIDWMIDKTDDIYFMREGALLERVKSGFAQDWDWRVQLKYITDHYFFLLDDMGSTRDTEFQKDILTEFVFSRYESGLPTVISTNYNEAQIKQILGERIHSRLFAKENTAIDMFGYPDLRVS